MAIGFGPVLPLRANDEDGAFALHKGVADEVKENFKTLLKTNPGERIMDSNFGIGIRRYLFEQNVQQTHADIDNRIRSQTKTYIPAIRINSIKFITPENNRDVGDNYLGIRIDFTIVPLKVRVTFDIPRSDDSIIIYESSSPSL
jgi:phage baseplate assembly protein W